MDVRLRAKHTPGPWIVKPSIWAGGTTHIEGSGVFSVEDAATETVICDRRVPWPEQADVMAANARLIAAAPLILAALERSLNWLSSYPGGCAEGAYDQARAAIAAATEGGDTTGAKR